MIKRIYIKIIIGITILVTACIPKPIPISLDQAPVKLAISSQIIPGQAMLITVTKSFSALQATDSAQLLNQFLVNNARVTLTINGVDFKLPRVAPGVYGNLIGPNPINTSFKLSVYDSTTGLSAFSQTTYQATPSLDSIKLEIKDLKIDTQIYALVSFTDLPDKQFYMINAYSKFTIPSTVNVSGLVIDKRGGLNTFPISDEIITQANHTEKIRIRGFKIGDTCTISIAGVDKQYYQYLVERTRARSNGLNRIFGEPVTYTTNVIGGYGFFTATIPKFKEIIIK